MAIKRLSELDPNRPQPAPLEYVGKWVAWNRDRTQVIASGRNLSEAHRAAMLAGYAHPIFEHVRPATRFIGAM